MCSVKLFGIVIINPPCTMKCANKNGNKIKKNFGFSSQGNRLSHCVLRQPYIQKWMDILVKLKKTTYI
jgi:hypothetical protein